MFPDRTANYVQQGWKAMGPIPHTFQFLDNVCMDRLELLMYGGPGLGLNLRTKLRARLGNVAGVRSSLIHCSYKKIATTPDLLLRK